MSALAVRALGGILCLFLVMAALLFLPAWTLDYWQGWTFLAVFFAASLAITLYLMRHDRALLERRMSGGPAAERRPAQRIVMALTSAGFVGLLVVPALDHRFGWSAVTPAWAITGDALVAFGWIATFLVFRENSYSAATIGIAPGQTVCSTGPYAIVRHPMYAGGLVMLLGMPVALGSWWGVLIVVALIPALIWRLLDEEALLARDLPGYAGYQRTVRWRLVPLVW